MKKLLLLFLFVSHFTFAQTWCQPGATWHYSAGSLSGQGYIVVAANGSTTINSKVCDSYTSIIHFPAWSPSNLTPYFTLNTYFENNKVYAYSNGYNLFYKLYDFDAIPGDFWYIYPDYPSTGCTEDSSRVEVDSISNVILNGDTLKKFFISYNNHSPNLPAFGFGYSYTEKLGGSSYLFTEALNCLPDGVGAYAFRCYADSGAWSYQSGVVDSCDFMLSVPTLSKFGKNELLISPNPSNGTLYVNLPATIFFTELSIMNAQGKEVWKKQFSTSVSQLEISENLGKGVYFLHAKTNNKQAYSNRFVIE